MNYKILAKFIKDISFEIPDAETFVMLEKEIAKYSLNFDIKSNKFKDNILEVNTVLRLQPNDEVKKKNYKVNTFHSKVIDKLGSNLNTFLISDDGEIEGIYNLEKKIIGVQFHPEKSHRYGKALVRHFMELADQA